MIPGARGVSSAAEAHELTLPDLNEGPVESTAGNIQVGHGLAVDPDPALRDQTPRDAGGLDSEELDEKRRQVDRVSGGQVAVLDLLGLTTLAHDAREMRLCPSGSVLAV